MEALNRKPVLGVKRSMEMPDGTTIDVIGIPARKTMEIANNKKLSDMERGIHITAAKLLINGKPVVADDLLDCFNDDELTEIIKFANPDTENTEKNV